MGGVGGRTPNDVKRTGFLVVHLRDIKFLRVFKLKKFHSRSFCGIF